MESLSFTHTCRLYFVACLGSSGLTSPDKTKGAEKDVEVYDFDKINGKHFIFHIFLIAIYYDLS